MRSNTQAKLRSALTRLKKAMRLKGDSQETMFDQAMSELRALDADQILPDFDSVLQKQPNLGGVVPFALTAFIGRAEVVERIAKLFGQLERDARDFLIQTIGLRRVTALEPILAQAIRNDPDKSCRAEAIRVAGVLRSELCWPMILQLAQDDHPELEWSLKDYCRPEGEAYLRKVFESADKPRIPDEDDRRFPGRTELIEKSRQHSKVIAAWGLAKLDDEAALRFLGEALFRDEYSFRAAQALADVFDLPFEWYITYRDQVRNWWQENQDRILHQ